MMPMQQARMDILSSEDDLELLVEREREQARPGQLKVRALGLAGALLLAVAAACAAGALSSGAAPAVRQEAASPEGLVQLSGQKAPKGKQQRASKGKLSADECAELRRLARSAKGGESEALEHLKSHGIDLEVLGIGQDPCQIALNAGDMADVKNTSEEKTTTTEEKTTTTEADECSSGGDDCTSTKCCSRPGAQCYEKTPDYAKCRVECVPGKDLTDVDSTPWSCKELGDRTPGEEKCSDVGDNCMETRCCSDVGFACYAKNKTFATCRAGACVPGPDYTDEDGWEPWTCEQLSEPTPGGKAAWVENECAGDEDDCREAACCRTTRYQCYEMGEGWAQCKADCSTEPDPERSWEDPWTCQELGPRTPESAADVGTGPRGGQVASWVRDRCSKDAEDCTESQCCTEVGAQCFAKDKTYAKCMLSCNSSAPDTDGWSCEAKGSPSFGIARKSWPSLFCFSVIHVCADKKRCYENALMNRIYELGPESAGIFGCDDWSVFGNEVVEVGGKDIKQIPGNISVGVSKDGTAANTELFMAVWQLVIDEGKFKLHDWTVKMDPDAVLLPWKLGDRLAPHTNKGEHGGRLFVVNCNAWPGSDFPMMYGSVEIFSQAAMRQYKEHVDKCMEVLPWQEWGEDYFLTRCMDQIDVGRIEDYQLVGDSTCSGPQQSWNGDCNLGLLAAFHPFKEIETWSACFDTAIR